MNRIQSIEEQLAHLRWKRMQNERKIRHGINTTKSMKEKDTILNLSIDNAGERATWMTSVIKDELSRPLVLSDEQMNRLQADEQAVKLRYQHNHNRSSYTLKKFKHNILKEPLERLGESHKQSQLWKLNKILDIENRLEKRQYEINNHAPIVHAKWSGHDDVIVNQQKTRRLERSEIESKNSFN